MSYLVFARRFRPQTFSSIVGQEHISKALANSIIRDRIPHAILLTGPRGVGKTTSARVFAKALNCAGRNLEELRELSPSDAQKRVEPCNECSNCREITRSASIAVREIDGASNNSVENVRELIDSLRSLPPPGSRYKVYVIDEVHMLSTSAFNALLKSLEEPPPHTVFIFATTDPQKIPETVISRCQRYDFRRLPGSLIVSQLREIAATEKTAVDSSVFDLIARKANGGMRDALSMFDQLLAFSGARIDLDFAQRLFGVTDMSTLSEIALAVLRGAPERCFELLDGVFKQSLDVRSFLADLVSFWRNLLLFSLGGNVEEVSEEEKRVFRELTALSTPFDLQRLFQLTLESADSALSSQFPRAVLEAGLARMAALPSLRPIGDIIRSLEGGRAAAENVSPAVFATAPAKRAGFNPSWHDFVTYVKNCSEPVLAAFLRRVSPRTFSEGMLELSGSSFDLTALQEHEALGDLKRCLANYSSHKDWRVTFVANGEALIQQEEQNTGAPAVPRDSIVAQEERAVRDQRRQADVDARNDPLVRAALSTFSGSKIDKVSVLKDR